MIELNSLFCNSRLTNPSLEYQVFGHPDEVVEDPRLSTKEKRALLASWASDANAVPHVPMQRQFPDGSIVNVDDILRALKSLDEREGSAALEESDSPKWQRYFTRRRASIFRKWPWKHRGPDDDDDPPPCPAYAARRRRGSVGGVFAIPEPEAA
jgi:hypothetical protein